MNAFRRTTIAVSLATAWLVAPATAPAQEVAATPDAALAEIEAAFGKVPSFLERYPRAALPGAWQVMSALESPDTELQPKVKELISLAVAAQIPCAFCIWAHSNAARGAGATDGEISEAVALAAQVRQWSTVVHGLQIDLDEFKADLAVLVPEGE
jgi:AhpD family alkylhydroperoxidase